MNFIKVKKLKYLTKIKNENKEVIGTRKVLDDINIEINKGEFIVILGQNGSGKSTFAKHLNGLIIPHEDSVYINGESTNTVKELWKIRKQCGMVFQNPDNQIVGATVEEDVAFGLENLGIESDKIEMEIKDSLNKVDMYPYLTKSPNKLSGGQKQRVAIASSIAMKPDCIILDEPTAMLDPRGREEVRSIIAQLNKENNITIVLITHHIEEAIDADRVVILDEGKIILEGKPKKILSDIELLKKINIEPNIITQLANDLYIKKIFEKKEIFTIDEFINEFLVSSKKRNSSYVNIHIKENIKENFKDKNRIDKSEEILRLVDICYKYESNGEKAVNALNNINLKIFEGEIIGIIGHTGSGKSTLLQLLNGLNNPVSGEVYYRGKNINEKGYNKQELRFNVGLVFQNPENQLFEDTIIKDVMFGPLNMKMTKNAAEKCAREALLKVGIGEEYYYKSPFTLSGGEMRRVAIAGVLAMRPQILVLDEPMAGLDSAHKLQMFNILRELNKSGITIIMVSHDMDDIANFANRIVVLDKGSIVFDNTILEVFSNKEKLVELGLSMPKLIELSYRLRDVGFQIESTLKIDEFENQIIKYFK